MQINARRHSSFGENGTIFHTICWEDALEKSTKFELAFWLQSVNYAADVLDKRILSIKQRSFFFGWGPAATKVILCFREERFDLLFMDLPARFSQRVGSPNLIDPS